MLRKVLACVTFLPLLVFCASGCGNDESKDPKIQKAGTTLEKIERAGKKSESRVSE